MNGGAGEEGQNFSWVWWEKLVVDKTEHGQLRTSGRVQSECDPEPGHVRKGAGTRGEEPPTEKGSLGQETGIVKITELYSGQGA